MEFSFDDLNILYEALEYYLEEAEINDEEFELRSAYLRDQIFIEIIRQDQQKDLR